MKHHHLEAQLPHRPPSTPIGPWEFMAKRYEGIPVQGRGVPRPRWERGALGLREVVVPRFLRHAGGPVPVQIFNQARCGEAKKNSPARRRLSTPLLSWA